MKSKVLRWSVILLLAVAAGIVSWHGFLRKKEAESLGIRTTGIVKALETSISSKIAGRLMTIRFREGYAVQAGDLAAEIESSELNLSSSREVIFPWWRAIWASWPDSRPS